MDIQFDTFLYFQNKRNICLKERIRSQNLKLDDIGFVINVIIFFALKAWHPILSITNMSTKIIAL